VINAERTATKLRPLQKLTCCTQLCRIPKPLHFSFQLNEWRLHAGFHAHRHCNNEQYLYQTHWNTTSICDTLQTVHHSKLSNLKVIYEVDIHKRKTDSRNEYRHSVNRLPFSCLFHYRAYFFLRRYRANRTQVASF
jgi:hypothetical protein